MFAQNFASYQDAYPEVESVTIASYEEGVGVPTDAIDGKPRRTYGPALRLSDGYIRCSHPRCNQGGFPIDWDLQKMVSEKSIEKEFSKQCTGHDGSPKGRNRGFSCYNKLHYRLTIKYKSTSLCSVFDSNRRFDISLENRQTT